MHRTVLGFRERREISSWGMVLISGISELSLKREVDAETDKPHEESGRGETAWTRHLQLTH